MTSQNIASSRPASSPQRRIRTAAAIAGVAAVIATGGYFAATSIGPDAAPSTPAGGTAVNPSAQMMRELRESIAGQYGNRFAGGATVNPNAEVRRELRESIAGQYAPAR